VQRRFSPRTDPPEWQDKQEPPKEIMSTFFAFLAVIYGPLILTAFGRWLAKRIKGRQASKPLSPRSKHGLKRKLLPSEKWTAPDRTAGEHWRN